MAPIEEQDPGQTIERLEHALRESEERYQLTVEYAPEAVVVMDVATGRFITVNPQAERLFGMSREDLLSCGPADVSPSIQPDGRDSAEAAASYIERALAGERPVFEWLARRADGTTVPCEVRLLRLPGEDRRPLVRGSITDISPRRYQELSAHLVRLDRRLVSATSVAILLDLAFNEAILGTGASAGAIGLVDGTGLLKFYRQRGFDANADAWRRRGVDAETPAGRCLLRGEPVFLADGAAMDREFPSTASLRYPYEARVALPLLGADGVVGVLYLAFSEAMAFDGPMQTRLVDLASRLGHALERMILLETAQRSELRTLALQRITAALGADMSPSEIARSTAEGAAEAVGAHAATVALADDQTLTVRAVHGPEGSTEPLDAEVDDPVGIFRRTLRSGEPMSFGSREDMAAAFPDRARELEGLPSEAALFLPIPGSEGVLGVLRVTRNEDEPFDEHEAEVLTAVVRQSGQAIDRARHLESRERALARERVLNRVTQGLASDRTVQQMGETMLDGVELFEASMIYIGAVDLRSGVISMLAARGFDERASVEHYANVSLQAHLPIAEACRTGRLVEVVSRSDVLARYPERLPAFERLGIHASVVQPVLVNDEVVACIALNYRAPHRLRGEEEQMLETLSRILAQALARARAYEAELTARRALQRAMSRLGRLQSVTASLTRHLRRDEVAESVLRQVKAALGADAAGLFIPDPTGALGALGDEGAGGWRSAVEGWPGAERVVEEAFRAGQPIWIPSDAQLRKRYAAAVDHAATGSVFATPLHVDDATIGVLGLLFRQDQALSKDERRLASTIGQQAAQALERARLYEAERSFAERTARLQKVAAALAAAATPLEVADVLAGDGARAVDAVSCVVGMVERDDQRIRLVGPGHREVAEPALDLDAPASGPLAMASRRAVLVGEDDKGSPDLSTLPRDAGERSWASLPLITEGGAIGFLTFGFSAPEPPMEAQLDALRTMASQASQALERARLFALEHEVARVLQESLLPPQRAEAPMFGVSTRYEAGAEGLEVGGDWFEIVSLPGERIGIAVGDVVGRGLNAAASMGQLRSALRALAMQGIGPRGVLDALERFAARTPGAAMSTVIYGELDPDTGEFRFCNAGHPPPLLEIEGDVRVIDEGRSPLLAAGLTRQRADHVVSIPAGATLVLYTDGLVERRGELFDRGIQRLSRALRATSELDLEARCDELLARMLDGVVRDDDVALLCVRRAADAERRFRAWVPADPAELGVLRHRLDRWLRRREVPDDDVEAVVLAVNEAVANAIEHGSRGRGRVELAAELIDDELVASVHDQGSWLDRPSSPDRGRGLVLVRALMDTVDVRPGRNGAGTTLVLRRRTGARADR